MWIYGHFLLGGERLEFPWKLMKSERTPWKIMLQTLHINSHHSTKPSDQSKYIAKPNPEDPCMVCLPAFPNERKYTIHGFHGKPNNPFVLDAVAFWCQVTPSYRWKACAKIASSWHLDRQNSSKSSTPIVSFTKFSSFLVGAPFFRDFF